MFKTLLVSKPTGWLKAVALCSIVLIVRTLVVSSASGWLKEKAS